MCVFVEPLEMSSHLVFVWVLQNLYKFVKIENHKGNQNGKSEQNQLQTLIKTQALQNQLRWHYCCSTKVLAKWKQFNFRKAHEISSFHSILKIVKQKNAIKFAFKRANSNCVLEAIDLKNSKDKKNLLKTS